MNLFAPLAVFIALQLGGCAVVKTGSEPTNIEKRASVPLDLIARNFVSTLNQLQSVLPAGTTVDMPHSDRQDAFTSAMLSAFVQSGYGIRWIEDDSSASLFQYRKVVENAAASARRDTYELAVGEIEMRRGYAYDGGQRVRPVTPLYIRGADASGVRLDDTIFDNQQRITAEVAKVDAVPLKPQAIVQNTASSTVALKNTSTLKVPNQANPLNPMIGKAASGPVLSLPLMSDPNEGNVFDLGVSNFADALAGRSVVAEQILIFGNDSMRLGSLNKKLLEQMVERFDPDLDVFSVIGCSMGPTQVQGGNAALALGRAGRVAEALRYAGVDEAQILDEGCWAGDGTLEDLPRRGVVLTLNRQA